MTITSACILTFSVSIGVLALSVIFSIVFKRSRIASGKYENGRNGIMPFHIFLMGFFVASTVMAYPVFYYGLFGNDTGVIRSFKSVMISVLNSLQMLFLNADFGVVKDAIGSGAVKSSLAAAYTTYFSLLYVLAPFLTFGFILSFFKDFSAKLKYTFYPAADLYIFSEVNERSLALAEDITENGKGRKLVVFSDVYGDKEEETAELIAAAKRLGALCFKNDITEIRLKGAKKNHKRKFYFISEDEDKNLKQALELIEQNKASQKYNNYNTQFFVFANSKESEVFLDSIDNGNMKVRRITEYRNTILNTLRSNSLFKHAVEKGNQKVINLVIVGIGKYGKELLKTVCWLGQMPGYVVNIHAFDVYNAEEKLKIAAPEFLEKNGKKEEGEPYYNIVFHNDIDANSSRFCDELSKIKDVTTVYVALGNDELNIDTAVKVRTLLGRASLKHGSPVPPIYTIVFNAVKSEIFNRYGGFKSISGKDYNIQFIDGIGSHYRLDVIEQIALEEEGLKCHLRWAATSKDVEEAKKSYERYEYNRRSSIAESAHKATMIDLGLYKTDESGKVTAEIAEYEHKRWNAYMRAEGYVCDKVKDDIAKTHHDLKAYKSLSEDERKKDEIVKA